MDIGKFITFKKWRIQYTIVYKLVIFLFYLITLQLILWSHAHTIDYYLAVSILAVTRHIYNTNVRLYSSPWSMYTVGMSTGINMYLELYMRAPQLFFAEAIKYERHTGSTTLKTVPVKLYDRIIIGGGAAGCPLARTLADAGLEVLLIERGGARKDTPETLDIYGAGVVIDNPSVSQVIVTAEGIRSHIANVLSGGTAINMAIIISEVHEFFDYLETYPGVQFDRAQLTKALNWTISWLAHKMPDLFPYGHHWQDRVKHIFGPNLGNRTHLAVNHTWQSYTQFNVKNNWYREAADGALGIAGKTFPLSLHVLLRHVVHQIEFTFNPKKQAHHATCVLLQRTTSDDIAPILSSETLSYNKPFFLGTQKKRKRYSMKTPPGQKYRACIKPDGEIISSAGAVLTPVLLFKSGVGPKETIQRTGLSLIKEVPELGLHLKDRVLVPVGLFFKDPLPPTGFTPRICPIVGLAPVGPDCTNYKIGDRTLKCTTVTLEELSGARIAEGTIYSSRFIIPPEHRNDLLFDIVFQIIKECSQGQIPFKNVLLSGLCSLARPVSHCFRKVVAHFYFTAEPKSIGSVSINPNKEVVVEANYLSDPQDLQDAIRGIASIIRVVNSDEYGDIFEPAGLTSCPMTVLNGLLSIVENHVMRTRNIVGLSAKTESSSSSSSSSSSTTARDGSEWIRQFIQEQTRLLLKREAEKLHYKNQTNFNHTLLKKLSQMSNQTFTDKSTIEGLYFKLIGGNKDHPKQPYWSSQKYATYPPILPEETDALGLAQFAKTWMTSIWHWVGSARMGVVVDNKFLVKGFDNLRIVDASVLNQVTRMNPIVTVVSLGRYAGLILTEALNSSSV